MAVKIVKSEFDSSPVPFETILDTVEKNRDRVRSIGAMVLTLCGILISASNALILFMTDKRLGSHRLRLALGTSVLCFGASAVLAVISCFLRREFPITNRSKFLLDMLAIYRSELFLLRLTLLFLVGGLFVMMGSMFTFLR
jgi:hypothetical protein